MRSFLRLSPSMLMVDIQFMFLWINYIFLIQFISSSCSYGSTDQIFLSTYNRAKKKI